MTKPIGLIIDQGNSPIDGKPYVAIATFVQRHPVLARADLVVDMGEELAGHQLAGHVDAVVDGVLVVDRADADHVRIGERPAQRVERGLADGLAVRGAGIGGVVVGLVGDDLGPDTSGHVGIERLAVAADLVGEGREQLGIARVAGEARALVSDEEVGVHDQVAPVGALHQRLGGGDVAGDIVALGGARHVLRQRRAALGRGELQVDALVARLAQVGGEDAELDDVG